MAFALIISKKNKLCIIRTTKNYFECTKGFKCVNHFFLVHRNFFNLCVRVLNSQRLLFSQNHVLNVYLKNS